jgi:hypothetical protein
MRVRAGKALAKEARLPRRGEADEDDQLNLMTCTAKNNGRKAAPYGCGSR